MFCRNCGQEIIEGQNACLNCGFNPLNGDKFCQTCGAETNKEQSICIKCGFSLTNIRNKKYKNDIHYDLLSSYYQSEFRKIEKTNEVYRGKFNWFAFLFTWIWCFTKGLTKQAFIVVTATILTCGIALIVLSVYLGANGTKMYYRVSRGENFWF